MWLPSSLQCHGDTPHSQRFASHPFVWPDHWYAQNRTRKNHSQMLQQEDYYQQQHKNITWFFPLPFLPLRWKSTRAPSLHPTWLSARLKWSLWRRSTVTWSAASRWWTACRMLSTTSTSTAAPTLTSSWRRMRIRPNISCSKWTALVCFGTAAPASLTATVLV